MSDPAEVATLLGHALAGDRAAIGRLDEWPYPELRRAARSAP